MLEVVFWYLILSLVGWLSFPLAYKLLPALADRGFAFSRSLGWLLWGYLFWLLTSLGVTRNDPGGILFALAVLIGLSIWAYRTIPVGEFAAWLRNKFRLVGGIELLFLLSFIGMALVRAANPEIIGTEKPMELAFINAILHSPNFPPHDPWLSGYAISYYYFGYVLVAMLAKLAGTAGSIAFNLGITAVFAVSMVAAYGLVYNLLAGRQNLSVSPQQKPPLSLPLLGPLFVIIAGNLEGVLHVLHTRGLLWKTDVTGVLSSAFWKWLDIQDLTLPPEQPYAWVPTKFWWWWRASRVLQDYDLAGRSREIIDEFPAFSYLLADLHPHVLAMPFAFLGLALALNLALGGGKGNFSWFLRSVNVRTLTWIATAIICAGLVFTWVGISSLSLRLLVVGVAGLIFGGVTLAGLGRWISQSGFWVFIRNDLGKKLIGFTLQINPVYFLLAAVILGGLAFLNTWDFPIYVVLFAASYLLSTYYGQKQAIEFDVGSQDRASSDNPPRMLRDFIAVSVISGIAGVLLYFPFYTSFSSQAGGILPSLAYVTRGAHFWVMFGVLLIPLIIYLAYLWKIAGERAHLKTSTMWVIGIFLALLVGSLLFGAGIALLPGLGDLFLGAFSAPDISDLIQEAVVRRLVSPGAWVTLLALLIVSGALLWPRQNYQSGKYNQAKDLFLVDRFGLLLIMVGGALVLGIELFFLRDQFGWRMNTIFKFYYQTWLMWGIVAAFGSGVLLRGLSKRQGTIFGVVLILLLGMGLTYTFLGFWSKTEGFSPAMGWSSGWG